jgi:transcriptional regulator with XRE-family HTH domain
MVDNLSSFVNWLQAILNEKNVTQADIARIGFVTSAAVSKLFTLQLKSVGVEMCRAISVATNTPLVTVYRKAGHLPILPASQVEAEEMTELIVQITDEDLRQDAKTQLNIILNKQRKRRGADSSIPPSKV